MKPPILGSDLCRGGESCEEGQLRSPVPISACASSATYRNGTARLGGALRTSAARLLQ
jgi:hypothetical protein